MEDWRKRCSELETDLNAARKDGQQMVSEMYLLKSHTDEVEEVVELLRRDNKNLSGDRFYYITD